MSDSKRAEPPRIQSLCSRAALDLKRGGIQGARREAERLLAHVLGVDRTRLLLDGDRPARQETADALAALVAARLAGAPLQVLLGRAEFMGRSFSVDQYTLVPRDDTETLVAAALEALAQETAPRVLDLCTGSGIVGISLALARPDATVLASDISEGALAVARANAARLGARVDFFLGDLFDAMPQGERGPCSAVVANPPYIDACEMKTLPADVLAEPHAALYGGPDGLDFYRRIAGEAPDWLVPGGSLLVEIGWRQAQAVCDLFANEGLEDIRVRRDLAGRDRVVQARKPS